MTLTLTPLDRAAARLEAIKSEEAALRARRLQAENDILDLVSATTNEGTVTTTGALYTIKVTYGINRTVDRAAFDAIKGDIPDAIRDRIIRWKPEVDLRELRYVQQREPAVYGVLAQAITAKPAKPSVSVEAIEAKQEAA